MSKIAHRGGPQKRYHDICIEVDMASEVVLGMRGEVAHNGVQLAGFYPHEQVKIASLDRQSRNHAEKV